MIEKDCNILIVGDYPPPYGGVSVQVAALHRLLSERTGFTPLVLDIGESRRQRRPGCLPARGPIDILWKLASHARRGYLIHLHTNGHNPKSWLVCFLCAAAGTLNRYKTVASIGSGLAPDFITNARGIMRALVRCTLNLLGAVICRNERTKQVLLHLGIPAEKVVILEGFYGVQSESLGPLPSSIEAFLTKHSPVLGAMASVGPEYGIPLLLEAAKDLHRRYPSLGVLLIGPGRLEDNGMGPDLLVTGSLPHHEALGALQRINVFVRPTYFDGDASSVREALALGVPVVASSTDFRPDGVILFDRGKADDLAQKIAYSLQERCRASARPQPAHSRTLDRLLSLYEQIAAHT